MIEITHVLFGAYLYFTGTQRRDWINVCDDAHQWKIKSDTGISESIQSAHKSATFFLGWKMKTIRGSGYKWSAHVSATSLWGWKMTKGQIIWQLREKMTKRKSYDNWEKKWQRVQHMTTDPDTIANGSGVASLHLGIAFIQHRLLSGQGLLQSLVGRRRLQQIEHIEKN